MEAVMEKTEGLPKGWKQEPLSELMEFATGGVWGDTPDTANGIDSIEAACIRGTDFRDWDVRKASAAVSRAIDAKSLEKRKLQAGDILVEVSGGGPEQPVGRTVHIDEEAIESAEGRPVVPTNFLRLLRLRRGVDAAYVNYYLKYFYVTGNISDYQGGSNNLRNLRFKDYITIDIPLAPLPQQRRIVSAIELQLGRLDAAVARLHGAKAKLKRYRQAVLKAAYDQFEKRPLEELTTVITKGASPSWQGVKYVNDPGQTLFVTSENVREGFLDLSEPKYVENSFNALQKRSVLKNGDVLLNIVGASIGRAAIYERDDLANTNQAVCLIRTTDDLDNGFLCNYLNSEEAKTYYSRNQVDVARANLSLKDVRELPVPYVPVKKQRAFSLKIDQDLASANEMEATLDAELVRSTRLRQAVLKRAFEGRLG